MEDKAPVNYFGRIISQWQGIRMQVKSAMASSRCYDNSDVIVILTITQIFMFIQGGWGEKGGISKEIRGTVHLPV